MIFSQISPDATGQVQPLGHYVKRCPKPLDYMTAARWRVHMRGKGI
ncbi:UNVERIFIED_CONTAM: hypothetical protein RKD50_005199 [Streptomyces canus]